MVSRATPAEIGARVKAIRHRRGMSLTVTADLAGISRTYLKMLERGERRFERRGLLETLATVLGCAPTDLTGQPYPARDRATAEALAALGQISVALYDCSLTDVPDIRARPVAVLADLAHLANVHTDESHYGAAAVGLGAVLTELHVHAVTGDDRRAALAALAEACFAAAGAARQMGRPELAIQAARRSEEAAELLGAVPLQAFAAMTHSGALTRLGARRRAGQILTDGLTTVAAAADPTEPDPAAAEGMGMLHLAAAHVAARERDAGQADRHLAEAADLAQATGERNTLRYHFGPANVDAWSLAIAVELERGPSVAEQLDDQLPARLDVLASADRRAGLHLDLARAWAQSGGDRDAAAVRHLDAADRIAPARLRNDPIARELVAQLDMRARRRVWELDSLRHRFGLVPARAHSVP